MRHFVADQAPRSKTREPGPEPPTALAALELTPRWHLARRLHSIDSPEAALGPDVSRSENEGCCHGDESSPMKEGPHRHCCCHDD